MLWPPLPTPSAATAWTASEAAAFDLHLQQEVGLPAMLLMENAAAALASLILEHCRALGRRRVLLVAGPGNNGADALVAGRHLAGEPDLELAWQLPGAAPAPGSLGAAALATLEQLRTSAALVTWPGDPARAELLVDGLFGVGLARPLEGHWRQAVEAINAAPAEVLAVDLPSGLDGTSGEVLGAAVRADLTLSFIGPKRGCLVATGPAHTGRLHCADIGLPRAYAERWLAEARARG